MNFEQMINDVAEVVIDLFAWVDGWSFLLGLAVILGLLLLSGSRQLLIWTTRQVRIVVASLFALIGSATRLDSEE